MSGWAFVLCLFLALFFSVCLSFTLLFSSHFYLYSVLNLFFHVDNAKANIPCASVKRVVLLPGRIHSSHRLQANVFGNQFSTFVSPRKHPRRIFIWRRAKKPRRSSWIWKDEDCSHKWRQTKSRHNSDADICNKAVDYEFHIIGGITAELHGRTAKKTANIGIAIRQIPQSTIGFSVEIRFKTQVATFSDFPSDAMLWIKEVEMVDSVDDLKSSFCVRGIRISDFEVLDARIASALNRITHNTQLCRFGND